MRFLIKPGGEYETKSDQAGGDHRRRHHGHGFAQIFAQKGYPVFLYDIDAGILEKALQRIAANLDTFIENGLLRKRKRSRS